jgi:DNA-binding CsgD family transcriptional regulator
MISLRPSVREGHAVKTDTISIVEAAYDLQGDTRAWLSRLLDHVAPKLDRGLGVGVSVYGPGVRPEEALVDTRGVDASRRDAAKVMITAYPDLFRRLMLEPGPACTTAAEKMGLTEEQTRSWRPYVEFVHSVGIRDYVAVVSRDASGYAVFFSAASPDGRRPTRYDRALWNRIATHISAGARLSRASPGLQPGDVAAGAEAVLSPSGAIAHAEPQAQGAGSREAIRRAARAIDRARSKARGNDDEALDLWLGLVSGRWSLVDRFDTDGRRFLVACRNDPQVNDPRALTLRERQVLAYSAMGHPLKLIAYSLGLSVSTVSARRTQAMRKLGLRTQADVVGLFAPRRPAQG